MRGEVAAVLVVVEAVGERTKKERGGEEEGR